MIGTHRPEPEFDVDTEMFGGRCWICHDANHSEQRIKRGGRTDCGLGERQCLQMNESSLSVLATPQQLLHERALQQSLVLFIKICGIIECLAWLAVSYFNLRFGPVFNNNREACIMLFLEIVQREAKLTVLASEGLWRIVDTCCEKGQ